MALKKRINKVQYDALSADIKAEYEASGEEFALSIDGEDTTDWKQKREIEVEHRKKAEQKVAVLTEERDNLLRGAIPKADVEALENSWKTKLSDAETKHKAELDNLNGVIAGTTVKSTANEIATMFLAPAAMTPMISARLKSEIVNGIAVVRVLDKNGQPSALSVEDLKNEFKTDASLAAVLVGSKASGGGATGSNSSTTNTPAGGKKFKDMGDQERKELYQKNPEEFRRLLAESKNS